MNMLHKILRTIQDKIIRFGNELTKKTTLILHEILNPIAITL